MCTCDEASGWCSTVESGKGRRFEVGLAVTEVMLAVPLSTHSSYNTSVASRSKMRVRAHEKRTCRCSPTSARYVCSISYGGGGGCSSHFFSASVPITLHIGSHVTSGVPGSPSIRQASHDGW